jgi:CHASE2 domain-containing sensor protein
VVLLIASQQSQLNAWIAVLVVGFVVGVLGHVVGSRLLILAGILIVGGFSAYFAFGVGHLS